MESILSRLKTDAGHGSAPRLDALVPDAAMPGGEVHVLGVELGARGGRLPTVTIGDIEARVTMSRPERMVVKVPEGAIPGELVVGCEDHTSNGKFLRVAVPMAENLHPVSNPAVDGAGRVYATVSGGRGQEVPVAIFAIDRDFQVRPFVRELLNATGLAIGPDGYLYVSSRAEGTVYRVSPEGAMAVYAEGMGIATGIAFDRDGNLFVGDRSGTIFKLTPRAAGGDPEIFVFATLEPSMAAYHLAFNGAGMLFVTGPTTSSNQAIYAVDRDGATSVFYRGLGRAQGMAFDVHDNLYVAASLHGERGIVRITPGGEASVVLAGSNLVGLAFLEEGCAALATRDALYHVEMGVQGLLLA